MKQLTCEMCGSTELLKQEGVFVCQSCGCKYTVEEAKKLLLEVEGVVSVQGTVQVDRSSEINNRIQNAIAEYRANHQDRAIALFNDVLNIDFENVTAIIYKACADGWQSTLMDNHMVQMSTEICRALEIAKRKYPDAVKFTEMILPAVTETVSLSDAVGMLRINHRKEVEAEINHLMAKADEANKQGKRYMMTGPIAAASPCYERARMYAQQAQNMQDEMYSQLSASIKVSGTAVHNVAFAVMEHLQEADRVCDELIPELKKLLKEYNAVCGMDKAGSFDRLNKQIKDLEKRVAQRIEKERQEKIAAYWERHAQEKQALDTEKAELEAKSRDLNGRMDGLRKAVEEIEQQHGGLTPAEKEQNELLERRKSLAAQIGSLGIFKMKEKKQLKEEMALIDEKIRKMEDAVRRERKERDAKLAELLKPHHDELAGLDKEFKAAQARLQEIDAELMKDRSLDE